MSYGSNGSVIGPDNVPTSSAAPGVWSLGEIAEAVRDDIWPAPDSISKFGLLTLPTGDSANNLVLDLDTSGNAVALLACSYGTNYVVEIAKADWSFTYMRNYSQSGGSNLYLYHMGINPTSFSSSTNVLFLGGIVANMAGGMIGVQIGRVVKTGSTGWDDFTPYGTSNDGYMAGSMGGYPYTYQNYLDTGRYAFKAASDYPTTSDSFCFTAGGRWSTGSTYYGRFGVLVDDNAAAPTQNGYVFTNDSGYNSRGEGACGMVGTSAAVWLMDSTYWATPVLISDAISATGSNNDYTSGAQGQKLGGFAINLKTRIGPESHNGSQRVSGGNNETLIIGEKSGDLQICRYSMSGSGSATWARKLTPTTFGSSAYPSVSGGIVSTDGTKAYGCWASHNSDATNRGWIIIGCWNYANGTAIWQNRLTWADASEGTNTRFNQCDMKLAATDATDDSLILTAKLYQTTGSPQENVPILRLRSDGGGLGTYSFTATGKAGGVISLTYAADTSPEAAMTTLSPSTYTSWYNPGSLFGYTESKSSANAAVTSGYTWEAP